MACSSHGGGRGHPPTADTPPQAIISSQALETLGRERAQGLLAELPAESKVRFTLDATQAAYYAQTAKALALTAGDQKLLEQHGFVIVDHDQRYTFSSAYLGIYTRDLPVLVTTDSILHAFHRSYDVLLGAVEEQWMAPELERILSSLRAKLSAAREQGKIGETEARDVDGYLRVALALLMDPARPKWASLVSTHFKGDPVEVLFDAAQAAEANRSTAFRGGVRSIDFTQFTPRGRYTRSPVLERYFRAMMWLGRADTGFWLTAGSASLNTQVDIDRELRAATALSKLLRDSGLLKATRNLDQIATALVGDADNLDPDAILRAAAASSDLEGMRRELAKAPSFVQRIQSSTHEVGPNETQTATLPALFQLFGQRYALDSHVLSDVVHDRIVVEGRTVKRMLPSPLDVMAALGSDQAVRLLEPELTTYAYADQLRRLRSEVSAVPEGDWHSSLAMGWLSALRDLNPAAVTDTRLPIAMQTSAWQRKQLATQLASWAELRHDNVLYTKESYTMSVSCEYPYGYVEPYPRFFRGLSTLAKNTARVLEQHVRGGRAPWVGHSAATFFRSFAATTDKLANLADKELRQAAFDDEDESFLKTTAFNSAGCGGPVLSGWYPSLYASGDSTTWKPSVVSVHSNPENHEILHVGVGDANYLVTVLDTGGALRTFVGPVYSYYELTTRDERLTDERWEEVLSKPNPPDVPAWLQTVRGQRLKRELGPAAKRD